MHGNSLKYVSPSGREPGSEDFRQLCSYGSVNERGLKMGAAFCGRCRHGRCATMFFSWHGAKDKKSPEDTYPPGRQCQRLPRLPRILGPPVVATGTQFVSFPRQF